MAISRVKGINEFRNKIMILPVAKLGALFIKSLGKPLAKRLKNHAAKHPRFRQFIVNIAQVSILWVSIASLNATEYMTLRCEFQIDQLLVRMQVMT